LLSSLDEFRLRLALGVPWQQRASSRARSFASSRKTKSPILPPIRLAARSLFSMGCGDF
jgi:hypothetical protein